MAAGQVGDRGRRALRGPRPRSRRGGYEASARPTHLRPACAGASIPEVDGYRPHLVPGLFAVGDGAGIRGARRPPKSPGTIAGLTAAHERRLHRTIRSSLTAHGQLCKRLRSLDRFADAAATSWRFGRPRSRLFAPERGGMPVRGRDARPRSTRPMMPARGMPTSSNISRAAAWARARAGCAATSPPNSSRSASAVARRSGYWTGRPPLRPVALDELIGAFAYDDIPIPEPAPL